MSYLAKLLYEASKVRTPGLHITAVYHDNDCPKLNGGNCTCDAEVEVSEPLTDAEAVERIRLQQCFGKRWRS